MNTEILKAFYERYPALTVIESEIAEAYNIMESAYLGGKKLLVAGNGGSAADASHICGELMKSFRLKRPVSDELRQSLMNVDNEKGVRLADALEAPLRAICLTDIDALTTAYMNDREAACVWAQKLLGNGDDGDVFLALTTSGNSENVVLAAITAKAMGLKVIALTGAKGGKIAQYADVTVNVPETETFIIQELHLPVYHLWCQLLEERFFNV